MCARPLARGLMDVGLMVPSRGRDEDVVTAAVAPVEMGSSWAVPNFNRVVVGSVEGDRVVVAASEDMRVLFVAPFTVRTKRVAKVGGVRAAEVVEGVEIMEKSWKAAEGVRLGSPIILPAQHVTHAME